MVGIIGGSGVGWQKLNDETLRIAEPDRFLIPVINDK